MTLGEYLRLAGTRKWDWGTWDCCAFPAGWVMENNHPDPMALWRGRYSSAEEAQALIEEAGGLVELWAIALGALPVVEEPQAGDVAVCMVFGPDGLEASGGIYTGDKWAFLAPRGVYAGPVEPQHVIRIWRP